MRSVLVAAFVTVLAGWSAAAPTTQPDPPQPPYRDDPSVLKVLDELEPGRVVKLPAFKVIGDLIEQDERFRQHGPGGRDYCGRMCYAPSRGTALYAGANHGAPSRLNDAWEFHLGSNTWVRLAAGDGGDHGALYRARGAIRQGKDIEKNQAFLREWHTRHAELADGYLRTKRNHGPVEPWHAWDGLAWDATAGRLLWAVLDNDDVMRGKVKSYAEATGQDAAELEKGLQRGTGLYLIDPKTGLWQRQLGPDPRPYLRGMGGSLVYVPDWKKTVWYCAATNVSPNDFAMWTYDAAANRWQELKPNDGRGIRELCQAGLAPGSECQMAYSPRHRRIVAVLGKDAWAYDIDTNAWSHVSTVEDQFAHDARTVFDYDSVNDLFLLVNAPKGQWEPTRDLRALDPNTGQWRKVELAGEPLDSRPYARQAGYFDPGHNVLVVYSDDIRVVRIGRRPKADGRTQPPQPDAHSNNR